MNSQLMWTVAPLVNQEMKKTNTFQKLRNFVLTRIWCASQQPPLLYGTWGSFCWTIIHVALIILLILITLCIQYLNLGSDIYTKCSRTRPCICKPIANLNIKRPPICIKSITKKLQNKIKWGKFTLHPEVWGVF